MSKAPIVRKSKFRHVFGGQPKKEDVLQGVKLTKNAGSDSNFLIANPQHIGIAWDVGGGGAVAIIPVNQKGRLDSPNLMIGHKSTLNDLSFSPFHDQIFASVADDCLGKIWSIPKEFPSKPNPDADYVVQNLQGHKRKVTTLEWNPVAENVLATAGADYELKIWDVATGQDKYTISGHGGIIQSINWNYGGNTIVTYCKDKKMRFVDPRAGAITGEIETHTGAKGGKALWLGKHDMVISCGTCKSTDREILIYDPKKLDSHLHRTQIDTANGLLQPYYDEDTEILFVGGKGDGTIRYYEVELEGSVMVHFLSQYSSNEPAATTGWLPKRGCDVNTNEIARTFKITGAQQSQILQPISFKVPRKSDLFQDDIFPDCRADEPAVTKDDWFNGATATGPKTKSLKGGFVSSDKSAPDFSKVEQEKPLSDDEVRKEHAVLKQRVAYLEAELIKRDARIKELETSQQ